MVEIFADISDDVKRKAELIWKLSIGQSNPIKAAKLLNQFTEYYRKRWTEEEVDFLQFYFQTQMEMNRE